MEEFLILMPRCTIENAREIAIRLKNIIYETDYLKIGPRTASFGLSTLQKEDTLNSIVNRADEALFIAKRSGRNIVKTWGS